MPISIQFAGRNVELNDAMRKEIEKALKPVARRLKRSPADIGPDRRRKWHVWRRVTTDRYAHVRRGVIRTKVARDPQVASLDQWGLAEVDRYLGQKAVV